MAKNDNLQDFLIDVANAIRNKKGTTALINPQDFSAEIASISGSYPDLNQKPILNTSNTTSQTAQADETIDGTINLHKVSKTGALADTIQDSTHRTVTDTEKQTWNNKSDFNGSFNSLTDVPQASTGVAGIIQVATDNEAETGTNTTKAVNPKQLKTAIDGLGSVFTLKGSVANVEALPSTGNEIGDVYYVVSENVGYIWLNDGTTNRWEQLGLPIDLSGYVQFTDIINTLNSTASDKPLSAMQGKVLNDQLNSLSTQLGIANTNISTLETKALVKPTTAPSNFELVGIDSLNSQTMVGLGDKLVVKNNKINLSDETITTLGFAESERQKSQTDGAIVHKKEIAGVEHVETIYDMSSSNANINKGYTSGISGNTTIQNLNFSKYKRLKIYSRDYWGTVGIGEIDFSVVSKYGNFYSGMAIVGNRYYNDNNDDVFTEMVFFHRYKVNSSKTTFNLIVEKRMWTIQPSCSGEIINDTDNIVYKIEGVY